MKPQIVFHWGFIHLGSQILTYFHWLPSFTIWCLHTTNKLRRMTYLTFIRSHNRIIRQFIECNEYSIKVKLETFLYYCMYECMYLSRIGLKFCKQNLMLYRGTGTC